MRKWAVGFYSLFDNELVVEIVQAPDWYEAMMSHTKLKNYELPKTTLEDAKKEVWNCDAGVDVVEIT